MALVLHSLRDHPAVRASFRELSRLARFGFVGVLATICYAAVTLTIIKLGLGDPISATIVGQACSGFVSYFGHLYFSFGVTPDHRVFLWRFLVIAAATFALNILVTWSSASVFQLPYQVPILVVTVLVPVVNYLLNRLWVFLPGLRTKSGEQP